MNENTNPIPSPVIVELAMEIAYSGDLLNAIFQKHGSENARACAMSNSVGGIGPLLKERIGAQSELGIDVTGVSLLYDHVWTQGFYQWGQIFIEKKRVGPYLREVLEDTKIQFPLEMPDGTLTTIRVWKTLLKKSPVYLFDAQEISNVVYPGPEDAPHNHPNASEWAEKQKLAQSWLIGRGTLALLKILNRKPDIIIQSETPTFFANHSLVMDSFQKDLFFADTRYIFNDHTPLEYAHPIWNKDQIKRAKIDPEHAANPQYGRPDLSSIDVTRLLIGISRRTYGVSKKHREVMKKMPSLRGLEEKITSITNGVSVTDWQDPDYRDAEKLSDPELIALKERKKEDLIQWVWKRYNLWFNWKTKVKGKYFVLWTRRITSYKRFDVLDKLLMDPALKKRFLNTDIVVMVGGRIHQNDNLSQNILFDLLDRVTRDASLKDRVIILDNYNIWEAPKLFHGVDGTIMLADDGREASATGFMKAQVNGALVIACRDGAIPESVSFSGQANPDSGFPENGFEVPYVNGQIRPEDLLKAFEQMNQVFKEPKERARMIRGALAAQSYVSIDRTAREMIELYGQISSSRPTV